MNGGRKNIIKKIKIILIVLITGIFILSGIGISTGINMNIMTDNLHPVKQFWESNVRGNNDTTPPVTTHSLEPPEPDGDNGYYVSDVEVTLNATDNESGVDRIEYRINGGSWYTISGENGTFVLEKDGNDICVEYRAFDNSGNKEDTKEFYIFIDKTSPDADDIRWKSYLEDGIWYAEFTACSTDGISGMDRVEFYINDKYINTSVGGGPYYVFTIKKADIHYKDNFSCHHYDRAGIKKIVNMTIEGNPPPESVSFFGIIYNPELSKNNVTFFAIAVYCSFYYPHLFAFERITIPNDYNGYFGKFFICISLNDWYP
jgi:hypothetical protein